MERTRRIRVLTVLVSRGSWGLVFGISLRGHLVLYYEIDICIYAT